MKKKKKKKKKKKTAKKTTAKKTATKRTEASAFLTAFRQEPGYPNWYSQVVPKLIFKRAVSSVEIWEDGQVQRMARARRAATMTVTAYCENGNGMGAYQDNAWSHFMTNAESYESRLRAWLWRRAKQNLDAAVESNTADPKANPPGLWEKVMSVADFTKPDSLELQVSLRGIGLIDQGPQRTGYICFEFDVGWDPEHGLSILMHRGKIVGVSGGSEFYNRGSALVPHLAYCKP